jgi:HEAT repeat protein
MKFLVMLIAFVVAGYFAFEQFKPKPPPPPPPPPPPAILLEPAPVISPEEQEKVIKSTNDQDPNVRWEALVFLDKMKSPQAMPLLLEKLRKDPELDVRIKIIRLLGDRRGPDVTQGLVGALRDMEPDARVEALKALDKIGDYSTASAITDVLKDQEETVRVQALRTLNSLQDKKAAEIAAERARQEELRRQAEAAAKNR